MKQLESRSIITDEAVRHVATYDCGPMTPEEHSAFLAAHAMSGRPLISADVRLTDGTPVGKCVGIGIDPVDHTRLCMSVEWDTSGMMQLAADADLKIDPARGLVVLQGDM